MTASVTPRAEHVAWCKQRALAYVDQGEIAGALTSLWSDLRKDPQTADHAAIELGAMLAFAGHLSSEREVREFIEGVQ